METTATTSTARRQELNRAPYTMLSHGYKLILIEEYQPLTSKKECKDKIRELNEGTNSLDLRSIKHKEKYYIYKRNHG